jgi:hypothetical protein
VELMQIPMTTNDLRRFVACLNLTQSDKEGEALAAMRAPNGFLTKYGLTWPSMWYDVESQLRRELMESQPTIGQAFDEILKVLKPGDFRAFIVELTHRWIDTGSLTERQREVLRNTLIRNNIHLWPRVITW